MKKILTALTALACLAALWGCGRTVTVTEIDIVPEPVFMVKKEGTYTLERTVAVATQGLGQNSPTAKYIMNSLRHARMRPSLVSRSEESDIELIINDTVNPELGDEGYLLEVRPNGVRLSANTETGLFYAYQTFIQMMPPDVEEHRYRSFVLPECTILDYPRFAWRGAHLEADRQRFPVKFIKKYLDLMATYKLNHFLLQLPDSSLFIPDSLADSTLDIDLSDHFYSAEDLADISDYAASLAITVQLNDSTIAWDDTTLLPYSSLEQGRLVVARQSLASAHRLARLGDRVVACPDEYCRLDRYQADPRYQPKASDGSTTLAHAYLFDPAPQGTNKYIEQNILGGQLNLWTSHISTSSDAEYMLLPRLLAMSESLWTPRANKNWSHFRKKVELQKMRLDSRGYNYCEGSFTPLFRATRVDDHTTNIAIETEVPSTYIFYTTDGSTPSRNSQVYLGPINLHRGTHIKILPVYKDQERDSVYEFIIK
jgi:N-acetyl-beta-hexosaminidase